MYPDDAWVVDDDGHLGGGYVSNTAFGVRPSFAVSIG
jgi:hypothetical protein